MNIVAAAAAAVSAPFEWVDGPLVTAMLQGDIILIDELNLAEDAVLERLNRYTNLTYSRGSLPRWWCLSYAICLLCQLAIPVVPNRPESPSRLKRGLRRHRCAAVCWRQGVH